MPSEKKQIQPSNIPRENPPIFHSDKEPKSLIDPQLVRNKKNFISALVETQKETLVDSRNDIASENFEPQECDISTEKQNAWIDALQNERIDLLELDIKKYGAKFIFETLNKKGGHKSKTILKKLIADKKQTTLNYLYALSCRIPEFAFLFFKPINPDHYSDTISGRCSLLYTQALFNQEEIFIETLNNITRLLKQKIYPFNEEILFFNRLQSYLLPLLLKHQQISLINFLLSLLVNYSANLKYKGASLLHYAVKLRDEKIARLALEQEDISFTELDSNGQTVFQLIDSEKADIQKELNSPKKSLIELSKESAKSITDAYKTDINTLNRISMLLNLHKNIPAKVSASHKYAILKQSQNVCIHALQNERLDLLEAIRKIRGKKFILDSLEEKSQLDDKTILKTLIINKKQLVLDYLYTLTTYNNSKFASSFFKSLPYMGFNYLERKATSLLCVQILFNQEQVAIENLKEIIHKLSSSKEKSEFFNFIKAELLPFIFKSQQIQLISFLSSLPDNSYDPAYQGSLLHSAIKFTSKETVAALLSQEYLSLTEMDSNGKNVFELIDCRKENIQKKPDSIEQILKKSSSEIKNLEDICTQLKGHVNRETDFTSIDSEKENIKKNLESVDDNLASLSVFNNLDDLDDIHTQLKKYKKEIPISQKPLKELGALIDSSLLKLDSIKLSIPEFINEPNHPITKFSAGCTVIQSEINERLAQNRKISKQESSQFIERFAELSIDHLKPFLTQQAEIAHPLTRVWTYIIDRLKILVRRHDLSLNYRCNTLLKAQKNFFFKQYDLLGYDLYRKPVKRNYKPSSRRLTRF